jgi:hypothetical protein
MTEELHDIERVFTLGSRHVVQCSCGEKFSDVTDRAAMEKQFHHGVQAMRAEGKVFEARVKQMEREGRVHRIRPEGDGA